MSWRRAVLAVVGLAAMFCSMRIAAQTEPPPLKTFQAEPQVWPAGTWNSWKAAFLRPEGRVVDNGNADISHSEGQGYGLLLAVLANDPAAFETMYSWTKEQIQIRLDGLASWRWDPLSNPHVTDPNNASDGDLLIAWALMEASERWNKPAYAEDSGRIAIALDQAAGARSGFGRVLMPGVVGFSAKDRTEDGPVVNPSYWVFPALDRLNGTAPRIDWQGYRASGYTLLKAARFGPPGLPTDWVSIRDGVAVPAKGFPPTFSYNSIRIPLYLAWGRRDARDLLQPYVAHYLAGGRKAYEYDVEMKANGAEMGGAGYRAILALAKCAVDGETIPLGLRSVSFDRYYSATLHMLALAAARLRFDKCL